MFENTQALVEAFGGLSDSAAEALEKMMEFTKINEKGLQEAEQKKQFREFVCARFKKRISFQRQGGTP